MSNKIEHMQIPVISTAHLTKEIADVLTKQGDKNPWVICAPYEYGYFLWINDREHYEPGSVPECLLAISDALQQTDRLGVWVRLDADADKLQNAPTYNW